ncbi:MAG: invasion protein CiaB [Candidatus Cloacimonetes bacterium]|nr:invasion protein CiaB [Candidatus Cloacimonadota bacterium]
MKTVVDFLKDLEEVQSVISDYNKKTDAFYEILDPKKNTDPKMSDYIDSFLNEIQLPRTTESRMAAISRLVSLRDDSLVQVLKKNGFTEESTLDLAKDKAYSWVSEYYLKQQALMLEEICKRDLLTPFYRTALKGWHRVGRHFTKWQPDWTRVILREVNRELPKQFDGDEDKTNAWLNDSGLIDTGHGGQPGDRAYSVLQKGLDGQWKSQAYGVVFREHVESVVSEIDSLKQELLLQEDRTFHEKPAWIDYLESLKRAFLETDVNTLILRWADVDRAWMQITSPIQPSHPLEYYEDHFRKAVALEWDIRIANPEHASKGRRRDKVREMSRSFFQTFENQSESRKKIVDFSMEKLDSVQLHIGRVGLFYGADFCGLPSAQVVPNDEVVSREHGKKIFAFPDNILQTMRSRPFVRLSREVFGQEFLKRERKLMFLDRELWFRIYDISTVGHEYGHILWVDEDTEARMNHLGNYKNVEEWKATTGGLLTFFMDSEPSETDWNLRYHVISDLVKRSIGLIAWRESSEVLPYYLEGLIHLQGLFDSKVLGFSNQSLTIDISPKTYESLKEWYFKAYQDLAENYYLAKQEPTPFLKRYAKRRGSLWVPYNETIDAMAEWYWDLYQKYGQEIDTEDKRENYLLN